jgi:uncharacterized protein HemX
MSKQASRRRRARCAAVRVIAVGGAAALVAVLGAGPALAILAQPDERVLERQGRINHQAAAGQADQQGKAEEPSQQKGTEIPRRWIRPEPPMDTGPRLDADEQVAPPWPPAPDDAGPRLTGPAIVAILAALVLAVGGAAAWLVRHRRPQPESTA